MATRPSGMIRVFFGSGIQRNLHRVQLPKLCQLVPIHHGQDTAGHLQLKLGMVPRSGQDGRSTYHLNFHLSSLLAHCVLSHLDFLLQLQLLPREEGEEEEEEEEGKEEGKFQSRFLTYCGRGRSTPAPIQPPAVILNFSCEPGPAPLE